MEFQVGPQFECPGFEIGADVVALDHLRLWVKLVVDAIKRVPDQQGAVAHDILRGPDRIEVRQIGLRDEAQRLAVGRATDAGRGQKAGRARRGTQKLASSHGFCDPRRSVVMASRNG